MAKYLSQKVDKDRTKELQALLDVQTELKAQRWLQGLDIWTGETLQGDAADTWLRGQFDDNEPDDLTEEEIERILGPDRGDFMQEFAAARIFEYMDTDDAGRHDSLFSAVGGDGFFHGDGDGNPRPLRYEATVIGPDSAGLPLQGDVCFRRSAARDGRASH